MAKEAELARDLAALADLNLDDLRRRWRTVTDAPVPRVSASLLRYAIAYELQAAAHGGLPRRVSQKLDQLAGGMTTTRDTAPGMRLMREWNGTLHVVTVDDDGVVHWNDRTWSSLSSVARAITGTRWSGPAFFGLKQRQQQRRAAA
ncbi:hypothetical protein AB433_04590 [Croceicoccus naphthovorans]|uniref:Bacteriophage-related protein n=2 Tax=Croceicoccus naphthovorans TaxID=1348774 RepID=A0A0G3XM59_9SPHN|nr:hypothetical protein AB433_04590 [Croceicoccus naphthovorans]